MDLHKLNFYICVKALMTKVNIMRNSAFSTCFHTKANNLHPNFFFLFGWKKPSATEFLKKFIQSRELLEKAMAPHSSALAWKIPWTEEPGWLQSMGLLRVRHDWVTSLSLFTFMHWRRQWQPTPVFLPGESQGWGSLVDCRRWGHTELDTTEVTYRQQQQQGTTTGLYLIKYSI